MEILAIIVLGVSTLVSFSTTERQFQCKGERRFEDDPDWAFTQSGDSE